MKPFLYATAFALAGCGLLATNSGGTTGGGGVCHSNGESCSSSADCCSGFGCDGTTCIFIGGNGDGNGSSGGSTSAGGSSGGSTGSSGGNSQATTTGGATHGTSGSNGGSNGSPATGGTTGGATSGQSGSSGTGTGPGTSGAIAGGTSGNGASAGGTSGPGAQYAGGWPKWHHDNSNSGLSPVDTSGLQGTVAWKFLVGVPGTGNTFINSPVVSTIGGGAAPPPYVVYQLNMAGTFYAISNSGTQLWTDTLSAPTGDPHPSTPAVLADGTVIVASGSDGSPPNIYAISDTGSILFSEPFGVDGFDSCPLVGPDGTVYLADDDGASSACGGVASGGDPYSALAFSVSGTSVAQIGGLALPLTAEAERFGVALGGDGTSYWGNNGQFFAIAPPASGFGLVPAWPACGVTVEPSADAAISDVALDETINDNLYAYSAWEPLVLSFSVEASLAALDPATGAQKWIFNTPLVAVSATASALSSAYGNAAPAIGADGTVYFGNGDGLYALDGATGAKLWMAPCGDVTSSPAIGGDGTIFFGCADGTFNAVNPDGSLRFQIPTGGPISASPAIAPDGSVIFVSDDGNVYDID